MRFIFLSLSFSKALLDASVFCHSYANIQNQYHNYSTISYGLNLYLTQNDLKVKRSAEVWFCGAVF